MGGSAVTEDRHRPLAVHVECYSGHRSEEIPRRFFLGTRKIEVIAVLDRWLAPDHRYFKVRGDDGGRYILRYNEDTGNWELTLFEQVE